MMLVAASPFSLSACRKADAPDWAIVPRLVISSSRVMPTPLSRTVIVRASLSTVM